MTAPISIRGLRKAYGDSVAVDSIDLEVEAGEVMALLGPSGCGKTTTLQLTRSCPRRRARFRRSGATCR